MNGAIRKPLLLDAHRPGLEAVETATISGQVSEVTVASHCWGVVEIVRIGVTFFCDVLTLVAEVVVNSVGLDPALAAFLDLADEALPPNAIFFFNVEFHRFLIWFSVLPGSRTAILAHLVPISVTATQIFSSSSVVYGPRLMEGSKWL